MLPLQIRLVDDLENVRDLARMHDKRRYTCCRRQFSCDELGRHATCAERCPKRGSRHWRYQRCRLLSNSSERTLLLDFVNVLDYPDRLRIRVRPGIVGIPRGQPTF